MQMEMHWICGRTVRKTVLLGAASFSAKGTPQNADIRNNTIKTDKKRGDPK